MSPRYARGVIVLALVALVPTVVHNYLGLTIDEGPKAASLDVKVPDAVARTVARPDRWFIDNFGAADHFERDFDFAAGGTVRLSVINSFDAKRLYHHPENAVAYGQAFHVHELTTVADRPGQTIHQLRPEGADASRRIAYYALLYRGEFVGDPLGFQVRLAGRLLVSAKAPMTLVFVQTRPSSAGRVDGLNEQRVLAAALEALSQ